MKRNYLKMKPKRLIVFAILLLLIVTGLYNRFKPMPNNLDLSSPVYVLDVDQVDFLYDLSYRNSDNEDLHEQEIFDRILSRIERAEKYILIDMFLFNPWLGKAPSSYRQLSEELTNALIAQKTKYPDIKIDLITDPINTVYGGAGSLELDRLRAAGINVIITNLKPLRDSNPIYSTVWRFGLQWFGNSTWPRWLKNPFSDTEDKVSLRSYLALLNFKANHRKIFMADADLEYTTIIMSANPHDSSSAHSNVAIEVSGGNVWQALYSSEVGVAAISDKELQSIPAAENRREIGTSTASVKLVTEKAIKGELLGAIDSSRQGDEINMAMFYLSDRDIITSLLAASARGASVRIILDPNKDAFGYTKNGIPNRQVANELVDRSKGQIKIRWYATNGEQFHSKLTYIGQKDVSTIILGSANLTRRNLDNYNLETDLSLKTASSSSLAREVSSYFEMVWNNQDDNTYTLDYKTYQDSSKIKYLTYRLQEALGLSSF